MSRSITGPGAIGALCCLFLALPTSASAKRIFDIDHPGIAVQMSLRGSHGYKIKVENGSRGRVKLTARKGDVFAEYSVGGRVTRGALNANFGRLGRVSVRFHRIGKPSTGGGALPPFKCKGKNPIRERGRFEGVIQFHGEQGFTDVSVQQAKGSVVHRFKRKCSLPTRDRDATTSVAERPGDVTLTSLIVGARRPNHTVYLHTASAELETEKSKRALFFTLVAAAVLEHRGRVAIERATVIEGDPGNILASPLGTQPVTATVSLPPPFAGTGSYLEELGQPPSWTGSLRVRLPGADRVPLTGPDFTASLCHGKNERKVQRCVDQAILGPLARR
jgi:hypothetical protein